MKKIIKLSLLGTLLSASTLAITFPIFSCSLFSDLTNPGGTEHPNPPLPVIELTVVDNGYPWAIMQELKNSLTAHWPNFDSQKELAAQWRVGEKLSETQSLAIMNNLSFKDYEGNEYKSSLVVDSIVFATETILSERSFTNGKTYQVMHGPEIKINLKDGFLTNDSLTIKLTDAYICPYPYRLV
ncbi:MAG: hypothetical protein ACRCUM_00655 [Mycoplasmoidaceae bacterium]